MSLKDKIKQVLLSDKFINKLVYKAIRPVGFVVHICCNSRFRSEKISGFFSSAEVHQRVTFTSFNRYPAIFRESANYFRSRNISNPSILSFGCSTGEEVFAIGKYLPEATITGVDINAWCIRQCLKANTNPKYKFFNRNSRQFTDAMQFDAIFCMAVFQRTENRTEPNKQIAEGHTFEKFEKEICLLDKMLNQNGLMIIDHSDFSFTDTSCASRYKPLECEHNQIKRERPLFDRNNNKVADQHYNFRIFVKQG